MEKQRTSLRKKAIKGLAGVVLAGVIALTGCATGQRGGLFGNYGRLNASKEVTKEFTDYKSKADHNYFIAGTDRKSPDAILALDNQYTLGNPRFWHPLNSQDKTLQDLVEKMKDAADNIPYGANVIDHNGNDIGDWYSVANRTIVKAKGNNAFRVDTPTTGGHRGGGSGASGGSSGGGGGHGGR